MGHTHEYNLSVSAVAEHFALSERTVRDHLKKGQLHGVQIRRQWRCSWSDVWAAEQGPAPRGKLVKAYQKNLLTKKTLAAQWNVSERTVERWIENGLPTRNVFGSVRIAPVDAMVWTQRTFGFNEHAA
ncbi:helix-turn-helix domain-containing protein [Roseivivax sp. CAU 1753]